MKQLGMLHRIFTLGATFFLAASLPAIAAETGEAQITGITGSVTVDGVTPKVGDKVRPGQQVVTGAGSRVDLYLGDNGPTAYLQSNSRASFDELTFDKTGPETVINTSINLAQGSVGGIVKKTSAQSKYVVRTPSATAAIRGTEYLIFENGAVSVYDGCVGVTFRANLYDVCAGQKFDPAIPGVVANDVPKPPSPTAPGQASAVRTPLQIVVPSPTRGAN
jgi:hypothetical protein